MKSTIASLLVAAGLSLAAMQTADAHGRGHHYYDPPRYYHADAHRDHRMPRWLRRKQGFRHWYRHSSLRRDHRLHWWQLYEIYRWEVRYDRRQQQRQHRHDRRSRSNRRHRRTHG